MRSKPRGTLGTSQSRGCDNYGTRIVSMHLNCLILVNTMDSSFRYEMLDLARLQLDATNPRIRQWIEIYGENPTAEQVHLALGAGSYDIASNSTTFSSLKESIRTNKGIINPIIVNRLTTGDFVVVEGNTRVAIYRSFIDDHVLGPWTQIPALVHDDLDQTGIDAIRLQAHLVGPRPRDPYSKAKYLFHLRNHENMPFNQLVDLCGGRRRELQDYIDAYGDMEKHYRKVIPDDGAFDWWSHDAWRLQLSSSY